MKKLTLIRHAKSDWSDEGLRDVDRAINERGWRAARVIGNWMAEQRLLFDLVLASPAVRVAETLDGLVEGYGRKLEPEIDKRIYLASSVTLIEVLRDRGGAAEHVMMCGHNPGMEDLVLDLVPDNGAGGPREDVEEKFPTASVAEIALDIDDWADLDNRKGRLERFTRPRDLAPDLGPQYLR
ncbi:SixA phosphatase family protein [Novosphingopyxis sp. YJ-S2-01]|uniref:SixA phosphatase family protein n=1 Tax=Novosphingopyxis sp. YJ-S2-01 TaxID=2794021 RepID=UPI0018DB56FB|nr:histidine phosphatase family protein [Novosphingopyxis sp. YJ-S2-01]MBH9536889.1 histidine phosphatase family protein [Novosphingopyxis sp. YJ-S2-01]|tara:strand:- start:450 stop:995 length:546 start_codon:yes stop_codon:yes gene_type:complete